MPSPDRRAAIFGDPIRHGNNDLVAWVERDHERIGNDLLPATGHTLRKRVNKINKLG